MKILIGLLFAATVITGCSASKVSTMDAGPNTLSEKEKKEGFQLLFDGTTTNGWHTYGYNSVGKGWVVSDGAIRLDVATKNEWPKNESKDILTNEEYENFHFMYDWKIAPKGNSGIIFLVHEDKEKYRATYYTGPEMQVIPEQNGLFSK